MATVQPGESWQAAYAAAKPGEIITLAPGLHPTVQLDRIPGRSGEPVVFRGGSGVEVQYIGSGKTGGSVTSPTGAELWTLEDVKVRGEISLRWGSHRVKVRGVEAGNIRITSCDDVLVQKASFGPYLDQVATINSAGGAPGVNRVRVEDCYFHDYKISNAEKHAEGMQIWPSAPSDGVEIVRCKFVDCTDFDILVKAAALKNLQILDCDFDIPMPGDEATIVCYPNGGVDNCGARWGSAIRLSTHAYPGAIIRGNIVKNPASIVVDNKTGVTIADNVFVDQLPKWPRNGTPLPPQDTQPPVITVPADIFTTATDENGAVVTFTVTAVDNIDSTPTIRTVPKSGDVFPIGLTRVQVEAADDAGNISTASFQVTVDPLPTPPGPALKTTLITRYYEDGTWDCNEVVVTEE